MVTHDSKSDLPLAYTSFSRDMCAPASYWIFCPKGHLEETTPGGSDKIGYWKNIERLCIVD